MSGLWTLDSVILIHSDLVSDIIIPTTSTIILLPFWLGINARISIPIPMISRVNLGGASPLSKVLWRQITLVANSGIKQKSTIQVCNLVIWYTTRESRTEGSHHIVHQTSFLALCKGFPRIHQEADWDSQSGLEWTSVESHEWKWPSLTWSISSTSHWFGEYLIPGSADRWPCDCWMSGYSLDWDFTCI